MFDWLKKLLFEEEIEETNVEVEKIDFTKVDNIENIVKETPTETKEMKVEVKEEPKKEVVEEIKETPVIKKEFNIQLTETAPKKEEPQETRPRRERNERSERPERTEKKDLEIAGVISPMFGGHEVKKTTTTVKPVMTTKKKDGLGTIISPIYGQAELFTHEKEALIKIQENSVQEELIIEDDDWKNDIPLDELITNEKENNDCVQFSLFGDDEHISE